MHKVNILILTEALGFEKIVRSLSLTQHADTKFIHYEFMRKFNKYLLLLP